MKFRTSILWLVVICAAIVLPVARCEDAAKAASPAPVKQATYKTPEDACEALIAASEKFDLDALAQVLGPDGVNLVTSDDKVQDKNQATDFAAKAREKTDIVRDPKDEHRATLNVGSDGWPMPIPLVEKSGKWRFDSAAGSQEILYRRVGENELNAIQMCLGYVEAQYDYASEKRDGALINQYAQRVISTPGKHDGLAWREADGSWAGPVGHAVAAFIAEGYTDKMEPFHGYYFKILKSQGPAAQMGEMDFVVRGVMIGGFALVAAPSNYGVTGVKTFIVGPSGVVFEKDLGANTLEQFRNMKSFNPDSTWTPVQDQ
ncbi:MAG TPA: DUF2950 domain-containing protein [Candidatus Didemnitutus sp.]|nr:DUF2950 domain-containing protein [Candidatus Didemnitutus sp.]